MRSLLLFFTKVSSPFISFYLCLDFFLSLSYVPVTTSQEFLIHDKYLSIFFCLSMAIFFWCTSFSWHFFFLFFIFILAMSLYVYSLLNAQTWSYYKLFSIWNKFMSIILLVSLCSISGKNEKCRIGSPYYHINNLFLIDIGNICSMLYNIGLLLQTSVLGMTLQSFLFTWDNKYIFKTHSQIFNYVILLVLFPTLLLDLPCFWQAYSHFSVWTFILLFSTEMELIFPWCLYVISEGERQCVCVFVCVTTLYSYFKKR